MNADLIDGLARVADSTENVPHLRRLVVALAISGKLDVSGDEESFALICERLKAERLRLIKIGKLKRQDELPSVSYEELPFDVSNACHFERLGNLAVLAKGLTGIQSAAPGPFPLVVTAEDRSSCDHFDFDGAAAIVPMVSSAGHGKASIKRLHYHEGKFALGNILCAVFPISEEIISARFLYEYLTAFKEDLLVTRMIGTANVSLTIGKIAEVPVPLVSRRIQQRVDELMGLCDRLEAAQVERESRRDRLVASSLNRLSNGADPDAFRGHARFYFNHLPCLTTRTEHIQPLRQTILNLAIWGKLVTQDPNDEPASELLKRVQAERTRLIESGNITKNEKLHIKAKPIPPDYCPSGWNWVRLRDVIWCYRGHNPPKSDFVTSARPGYVRFIQITDFKTDSMAVYVPITRHLKMVYRGEIIMAAYRHVGKVSRHVEGAFNVALCKVNEIGPMNRDFIELLIGTDLVRGELLRASERGHIPSMHSDHLLSLWVPIPPQLEQKRILEKYAELMSLCDRLEAQLTTTQTESRRLLEAVLHESLVGPVGETKESHDIPDASSLLGTGLL